MLDAISAPSSERAAEDLEVGVARALDSRLESTRVALHLSPVPEP
jgi:hypothetical protein